MSAQVRVIFRDRNPDLCEFVQRLAPESWTIQCQDMFDPIVKGQRLADYIVSPANCLGRMDGGIDAEYIRFFGWELQARVCHKLLEDVGGVDARGRYARRVGRVEIGNAVVVPTFAHEIPNLIVAPTMDWPPRAVVGTQNAYVAFRAAWRAAWLHQKGVEDFTVITPGLASLTGQIPAFEVAEQMIKAFKHANP